GHGLGGAPRLLDRPAGDFSGAIGLRRDLGDRRRQLLNRARRGGDVAGDDADPLLGDAGIARHRVGRVGEGGGCGLETLRSAPRRCAPRRPWRTARPPAAPSVVLLDPIVSGGVPRARPASACSPASRSRSIALSRKTSTVRAMLPISSRALVAGISAEVSPSA